MIWALLILYVACSVAAFVAFGLDKRAARLGRRRIPEAALHGLELLGGWPGALLAMRVFRHKSSKLRYQVVTGLIIAVHVGVWIVATILNPGR